MKNQEVKKSIETKDNESGGLQGQSFPGCFINMSSSGLTRGSRKKESMLLDSGSAAGMTRGDESGRSMVEMLGVLAIMGVLAIGGIAGYRWAMDKYNANEILNEVRKRAVTASQQRILGHAINLSEYGNNTIQGHAVTTTDNYNGDTNFFTITVKGIEQNICDKVLAGTIPFAIDTWVGDDADECVEGNNDITFAFKNTLDPEQPAEWETTATMTTEEIAQTEMATASSLFSGSSEYTVSGSDGIWGTGTNSGYWPEESGTDTGTDTGTGTGIQGKSCSSNEECVDDTGMRDETQYCDIEHYEWIGSTDACYANLRGTCKDKGDALTEEKGVPIAGLGTGTVWKGPDYMTWWSARNWCAAHGKRLIDISNNRLECYQSDGTTPFGATTTGYCCAAGQASCSNTKAKQSAIMQALRTAYGSGKLPQYFWTATPYGGTSDNSCYAFFVLLNSGFVDYGTRYNRFLYALCK